MTTKPPEPTYYTRVSTLAKALSDGNALADWKCAQTAVGVAGRPDLQALALASRDDKRALRDVVQSAMSAAGADSAANRGTAIHAATEAVDAGQNIDALPADVRADVAAYRETLTNAGVQVCAAERFVVCDDLEAAGTFNRLLQVPGLGLVIADVKTGAQAPRYALETAMQVAVYARGALYDDDEMERDRWGRPRIHPPSASDARRGARLANLGVRQDVGLLIHLPQGEARCELHTLDLEQGWIAASLAYDVRATRKAKVALPLREAVNTHE